MLYTLDTETGAQYVSLSDAPVARTVHVDDDVMVDVDEQGRPVGVEVLIPPDRLRPEDLAPLFARFPDLASDVAGVLTGRAAG